MHGLLSPLRLLEHVLLCHILHRRLRRLLQVGLLYIRLLPHLLRGMRCRLVYCFQRGLLWRLLVLLRQRLVHHLLLVHRLLKQLLLLLLKLLVVVLLQ